MAETEWWQRGPVNGVPAMLQPVAHILLQVREAQFAALRREGEPLTESEIAPAFAALDARVDAALSELATIDRSTLGDFRGVGRTKLPSTVIGCLVHGAEHAMRHVGQASVTARVSRDLTRLDA